MKSGNSAAIGEVLVIGATGTQGGAVARALLANGVPVRALVRNLKAPSAVALARAGAALAYGDLSDASSLAAAAEGVHGVFSVQMAPTRERDSERNQARALVAAARAARATHIVHASVSGVGRYRVSSRWEGGNGDLNYWHSKRDVEDMVRQAGFATHTILRPAFLMDNFAGPKAGYMFPDLPRRRIVTAVDAATQIAFVSAGDIASAAAAAFADPGRFNSAEVELAGDLLSFPQAAQALSLAAGVNVTAQTVSAAEAIKRGQSAGWVNMQEWMNEEGYPARPAHMSVFGLRPTTLAEWAVANRPNLDI